MQIPRAIGPQPNYLLAVAVALAKSDRGGNTVAFDTIEVDATVLTGNDGDLVCVVRGFAFPLVM